MAAYYATGGPASATEQPTLAPVLVGYISEAQSSGAQQSVDRINQAYTNLGTALGS
jgi:hypothetical protein